MRANIKVFINNCFDYTCLKPFIKIDLFDNGEEIEVKIIKINYIDMDSNCLGLTVDFNEEK